MCPPAAPARLGGGALGVRWADMFFSVALWTSSPKRAADLCGWWSPAQGCAQPGGVDDEVVSSRGASAGHHAGDQGEDDGRHDGLLRRGGAAAKDEQGRWQASVRSAQVRPR